MKRTFLNHPLRTLSLCALLFSARGFAHGLPPFYFSDPVGADHTLDGGYATITWNDYELYAWLTMYVHRDPIPPLSWADFPPKNGVQLMPVEEVTQDPNDTFYWDAGAVAPGCYQPYVVYDDWGCYYLFISPGKIVVPGDAGMPPSVFIDNPAGSAIPTDGGPFLLDVETVDPDDPVTLNVSYAPFDTLTNKVAIGQPITLPPGNAHTTVPFDTTVIPNGSYAILAEVQSPNGEACGAYWPWPLKVNNPPPPAPDAGDAGDRGEDGGSSAVDSGTAAPDSGTRVELGDPDVTDDAGPAEAPPDEPHAPRGLCSIAPSSLLSVLGVLLLAAFGRRKKSV